MKIDPKKNIITVDLYPKCNFDIDLSETQK